MVVFYCHPFQGHSDFNIEIGGVGGGKLRRTILQDGRFLRETRTMEVSKLLVRVQGLTKESRGIQKPYFEVLAVTN